MPVNPPIMRAIIQDGYGKPERVLRPAETEVPSIGADDVLIRVRATSVNTPDWATVAGVPYILRLGAGLRRPRRPVRGSDIAGVVEAVGQHVTDLAPGDEVFGSTRARAGAFAQYAVAPATQLVGKPAGLTFTDAAASVMSGLTALVAMRDVAQVRAGTSVLINGASGGVGTMAVQMATALGAEVTGVCGTRNIELVRSLGAEHVIDYTKEDFTQSRQRFDVILDNVLNHPPRAAARVLAPHGTFLPNSLGNTGGLFAGLPRLARAVLMGLGSTSVRLVSPAVNRENLTALRGLLESGEVKVVIDQTYPLDQAATAVTRMLEHHASGQIAITVQRQGPGRLARPHHAEQPDSCSGWPALLLPYRVLRLPAILDVTEPEPLPRTSVLYELPNVVLTPHVAGSLGTETRLMAASALTELERYAAGLPPLAPVTAESLRVQA